jgi:hypothetical protein
MSPRTPRDGRRTGVTGAITAEQQRKALGIATEQPREGKVPLSPAPQRKLENDEWPGEPLEDYEAFEASFNDLWGITSLPPPPGYRDGDPLPQVPKPRERPVGTDWSAIDASSTPAPLTDKDADEVRAAYRTHVKKICAMAESAKRSGDAAQEAKAAEEVRASAALGEVLKAKLGGRL